MKYQKTLSWVKNQKINQVITIILIAALLRIYHLGSEDLWLDETSSIELVSTRSLWEIAIELPQSDPHPPLYYLLFDGWISVFGTSAVAVRSLSVIFSIAILPVVYLLGRRLFNHYVGLFGIAFLAVSRFHIYHAQEARMYAVFAFFAALSFYFFIRFSQDRDTISLFGYAAFTALAVFTHVYGVFIIATQGLFWIGAAFLPLEEKHYPGFRRWIAAHILLTVLISPWIALLAIRASEGGSPSWVVEPTLERVYRTFLWFITDQDYYAGEVLVSVFGGLGLLALVNIDWNQSDIRDRISLRVGDTDKLLMLALWIAVPIVGAFIVSHLMSPIYHQRYMIAATLGFFVLIARGVQSVPTDTGTVFAAVLVLTLLCIPLASYYTSDIHPNWGSLTDDLESEADEDDLVLVTDAYIIKPINYQNGIAGAKLQTTPEGYEALRSSASQDEIRSEAEGHDQVFLVVSNTSDDQEAKFVSTLSESHDFVEQREYNGPVVYVFEV